VIQIESVHLGLESIFALAKITRANARELRVYQIQNLSKPISTLNIGTSPSLAVPYYDKDTGLIALAGRVFTKLTPG
jgi:hypothetical protein